MSAWTGRCSTGMREFAKGRRAQAARLTRSPGTSPSIAFYEKVLGSTPMKGWTQQRLGVDGIKRLQTLGL